jgi:5-formyltetrahydrofolate cyclo-ligase
MDPRPLLRALEEKGHILCLPCIAGEHLIFRRWTFHTLLISGRFGTREPHSDAEPIVPQIVLVPLVGFNRHGARLGQGQGYYDRTLAHLKKCKDVQTLGIGYGCQEVLESLPQESHDILLQAVATEKELIICHT